MEKVTLCPLSDGVFRRIAINMHVELEQLPVYSSFFLRLSPKVDDGTPSPLAHLWRGAESCVHTAAPSSSGTLAVMNRKSLCNSVTP